MRRSGNPILLVTVGALLFSWAPGWLFVFGEETAKTASAQALSQLIDEVGEFWGEDNPLPLPEGTNPRYKERMEAISKEYYLAQTERLQGYSDRLKGIDRSGLTRSQRIDYDVLALQLEGRLGDLRHESYLVRITNRQGFHIGFARDPENDPFDTLENYDDYVARLQSFLEFTRRNMALMKEGLDKGMALPKVVLEGYEKTIGAHIVEEPEDSVFFKPFKEMPDAIGEEDRARLTADGLAAIRVSVLPAYREFHTFMVDTYFSSAPDEIGVSRLPDGQAYYRHRIKRYTTLDLSAQQVHDIGLGEVARLRGEMAAVIAEVGFEGGFRDFLDFLRTDPRFYVDKPEDYLNEASYIAKRMDGQLPKLFKTLPKTPYGLKPIPDFIAEKTTGAYYSLGRPDSTRAGTYFLNLSKLPSRPLYVLEALTFHEAVPGHHLQIMLLRENEEIPEFRRNDRLTVFTEGWALYAERLGLEVGFYTDPYSNFGRLTYEIWRACRLVVDTGIHALGWSRHRAIEYMADNTALSIHEITTEVDRYISWPGQALAYKMGELKITELRRKAEAELGDRFDLREFHDALLRNGSIPLSSLEEEIAAFIAETKAAPHPMLVALFEEMREHRRKPELLPVPDGVDPRYHSRMPVVSQNYFKKKLRFLKGMLDRLDGFSETDLNGWDRLEAAVLREQLQNEIAEIEDGMHLMPISSREGFHVDFARLPEELAFRTVADYDGYVARLQSFSRYTQEQIALMREGIRTGKVLPRVVLVGFEDIIKPLIRKEPTKSKFFGPFQRFPDGITEKDRKRILRDGSAAIRDSVNPGYRRFLDFILTEYIPAARETLGVTDLPDGRAFYGHRIRRHTSLDRTAEEIHRIGLEEVARLRTEMTEVMRKTGFEGELGAFIEDLRKEPRFFTATEEDYLKMAGAVTKRMDGELPKLFKELPQTPYGLDVIPAFIAPRASSGYYMPGESDGTRAGIMHLNTSALADRPIFLMEALAFHEGAPGHHLQIMLQRENPDIPEYRRFRGASAFVEGWALYAERLGMEVGFYTDPYSDFGRLIFEIWRACRLVVDTGLHVMGWTRERARDYLRENTALAEEEIRAEVDRYISEPGQALSYKMGELAITGLRRKAEKALGRLFDQRDFHGVILRHGAIPVYLLEAQVDAYIREKTAEPR